MGHLEILVLGESLLDGGRWEQVLEYLKQEPTIGENVYVFRCAVASEAVAWVSPQDVSLGEYLLGLLENNPNGSPGQAVTLREVYHEFYEQGGKQSIRKDGWKLVRLNVFDSRKLKEELYYLPDDKGETNNLIEHRKEKVDELRALMRKAHTDSNIFRWKEGK